MDLLHNCWVQAGKLRQVLQVALLGRGVDLDREQRGRIHFGGDLLVGDFVGEGAEVQWFL
jgi:hypothetical protein